MTPSACAIIDQHLPALRQLCRRHHVQQLELFGSAAAGEFDPAHSDLDFLVEFESLSPVDRADAYFGLLAELQDEFQRNIDLVEVAAIENPYFKRTIGDQRTVLYAA